MSDDTPTSDTRRLQSLHDAERLTERIVRVAVQRLAGQLNRHDTDFDQVSEAIQVIGRILELRVQVRDLIKQATTQGAGEGGRPDAPTADHKAVDLRELALQREAGHDVAVDAPVSRGVPPSLETGE